MDGISGEIGDGQSALSYEGRMEKWNEHTLYLGSAGFTSTSYSVSTLI